MFRNFQMLTILIINYNRTAYVHLRYLWIMEYIPRNMNWVWGRQLAKDFTEISIYLFLKHAYETVVIIPNLQIINYKNKYLVQKHKEESSRI